MFSRFFIERPIFATVISLIIVIAGLVTMFALPVEQYPTITPVQVQVTTTYRGAAAEAVMESVATPIESKVNGVDKLLYLQSFNANDGKLTLNVYFDVGTDVDIMQVNTQNRVGQAEAQLPDAVKREGVVVNRSSPDILMVVALNSPNGTYDAVFLGNYCDINLVDAIKRVPGVGDVKNFTAQDYSMRVWLRPDKLAALGLTPSDIQNAIKEQNAQSPAGRIGAEPAPPGQEMQYNVRAQGLLKDPREFEEIIVRAGSDGSQVKIKDVGRVELGAQTYDLRARLSRPPAGASPAAAIGIYLAPGANAIETAENVKRILEAAEKRFPPDMAYDVTLDSTLPIKASMEEIVHTLFEAVVLVLIVVYIFLQSFRATIIPMCTVPVSLLGAFVMFPVLGFSVNVLTMFGLVLAIGIVVDDAIVVLENIVRHREAGAQTSNASLRVWGQRDDVNGRMHLWAQNAQHTWKRVVAGAAVPPVSGVITLRDVLSGTYRVTWWDTYRVASPVFLTQTIPASGTLSLALPAPLVSDVGIKIERIDGVAWKRVYLPVVLR